VNAFITLDLDHARELASAQDTDRAPARGPLAGLPIAVKDNIDTAQLRTTAGTAIYADRIPAQDAPIIKALRRAGAIIIGKTNLDELAFGGLTDNPHYGPTRNPWDSERFVAGSSGGSAAAVAAGFCLGALGTDTGGSVRLPASATGAVGLRPTYGRLPLDGITPLAPTMDSVGLIAGDVADCALLWTTLSTAGGSPLLHSTDDQPPAPETGRIRLGIPTFARRGLDTDVAAVFAALLHRLAGIGVELVELEIDSLNHYLEPWLTIHMVESAVAHESLLRDAGDRLGATTREQLAAGFEIAATDLHKAQQFRLTFSRDLDAVLANVDALLLPTLPFAPVRHGTTVVTLAQDKVPIFEALRFTGIASMAGLPAISLPAGLSGGGLPIGAQVVGAAGGESTLLAIARVLEGVTQWKNIAGDSPAGLRRKP
jgi:aspartyl-tRNA(Asn)/glutamyl-tRNA(Gln) amidotransferase subunit A